MLTFSHCFYVYTKLEAHNLHLHLLAVIALILTSCLYHWHTNTVLQNSILYEQYSYFPQKSSKQRDVGSII